MNREQFVIDLARCTGCQTCVIACQDRGQGKKAHRWLRVEQIVSGRYPHLTLIHRVLHCFHCERPACVPVCPAQAITQNADGWVTLDHQKCTGCQACLSACPFGAISLHPHDSVATKCDGCADEIAKGSDPTCVRACPMRALQYGAASQTKSQRVTDASFDDHGIGPSATYLRRPTDSLSLSDERKDG